MRLKVFLSREGRGLVVGLLARVRHLVALLVLWAGYGLAVSGPLTGGLVPVWIVPCLFWLAFASTALTFLLLGIYSAATTVVALAVLVVAVLSHSSSVVLGALLATTVGTAAVRALAGAVGMATALPPDPN